MDTAKLLDIHYLKENHTRIYYFGLGFIQVVLNQYERVHFYSNQLGNLAIPEGWHNHRYNFSSTILKGEFSQAKGLIKTGDSHILTNVNCSKDKVLLHNVEIPVGFELVKYPNDSNALIYYKGDSYDIMYNEFHYVSTSGNTITYLKRSDYITEFAQVVNKVGAKKVCPFSITFTDDELWELVEEIINN